VRQGSGVEFPWTYFSVMCTGGRLFVNFQDSSRVPGDGFRRRGQPASRLGTGIHTHGYEKRALGG